jgi:DNA modification methylase
MIDRINEQPFCQTRVMCWAVDNMELLKSQPNESVDLIYSDILYGTGRNFGDYQDLKLIRSEIEAHYLPRLIEMKRVLKQNGSIYLQMDTRINHWMRILMDDVFGYENFRNEIVWWYKTGGSSKKEYCKKHDVILFYAGNGYTFNAQKQKNYTKSKSRKAGVINYGKGDAEFFEDDNGVFNYTYQHDVFDISYLNSQSKERNGYATQKPKELISRFVLASTNEGDTVADYYLGSGTTAVVCKELNRNFIGCDINPKAIEITNARLDALS